MDFGFWISVSLTAAAVHFGAKDNVQHHATEAPVPAPIPPPAPLEVVEEVVLTENVTTVIQEVFVQAHSQPSFGGHGLLIVFLLACFFLLIARLSWVLAEPHLSNSNINRYETEDVPFTEIIASLRLLFPPFIRNLASSCKAALNNAIREPGHPSFELNNQYQALQDRLQALEMKQQQDQKELRQLRANNRRLQREKGDLNFRLHELEKLNKPPRNWLYVRRLLLDRAIGDDHTLPMSVTPKVITPPTKYPDGNETQVFTLSKSTGNDGAIATTTPRFCAVQLKKSFEAHVAAEPSLEQDQESANALDQSSGNDGAIDSATPLLYDDEKVELGDVLPTADANLEHGQTSAGALEEISGDERATITTSPSTCDIEKEEPFDVLAAAGSHLEQDEESSDALAETSGSERTTDTTAASVCDSETEKPVDALIATDPNLELNVSSASTAPSTGPLISDDHAETGGVAAAPEAEPLSKPSTDAAATPIAKGLADSKWAEKPLLPPNAPKGPKADLRRESPRPGAGYGAGGGSNRRGRFNRPHPSHPGTPGQAQNQAGGGPVHWPKSMKWTPGNPQGNPDSWNMEKTQEAREAEARRRL